MSPTHVSLEAADDKERGRHLGFLENGQIKSALATGREIDGQFAVRVIVSLICVCFVESLTFVLIFL